MTSINIPLVEIFYRLLEHFISGFIEKKIPSNKLLSSSLEKHLGTRPVCKDFNIGLNCKQISIRWVFFRMLMRFESKPGLEY